jgi:hypothetical protein
MESLFAMAAPLPMRPLLEGVSWPTRPERLPFSDRMHVVVSFFGGPLAAAVVAHLNLERLPAQRGLLQRTSVVTAVGLAVSLALLAGGLLYAAGDPDQMRMVRFARKGVALLMWLAYRHLQRSVRHRYHLLVDFDDDEPDEASPWLPGLAVLGGVMVVEGLLTAGIAAALVATGQVVIGG